MLPVLVSLLLLAALVWALNPRQPNLQPAPLGAPLAACAPLPRRFTPSDITDLGEPPFPALTREQRFRALGQLNRQECPCGCKLSVAACRLSDPGCKTSADLAKQTGDASRH